MNIPSLNLSTIQRKVITVAEGVYKEASLFREVQSPTLIAIHNGNNRPNLKLNESLYNTYESYADKAKNNRKAVDKEISNEIIRRQEQQISQPIHSKDSSFLIPGLQEQYRLMIRDKVANCGELANYFQTLLYNAGLPTLKMYLAVNHNLKNRMSSNHEFLVAGFSPDAILDNPNTWGDDAVALCSWWKTDKEKGLFLPVQAFISKIEEALKVDPQANEHLEFKPSDHYCNYFKTRYKGKVPAFATAPELPSEFKSP
jgi:hypothetical protein